MATRIDGGPWDTTYAYSSASGPSDDDATCLGHRYDPEVGLVPGESEAWVIHHSPRLEQNSFERGIVGWNTMLWRSPTRRVFVADSDGSVHVHPNLDKDGPKLWRTDPLEATVTGVWGLDDSYVFAWGTRKKKGLLFHWNGKTWSPAPSPGRIVRMSGISKNAIVAVGTEGLIARWDGKDWRRIRSPTDEALSGIHVVSEEEFHASGQGGTLLEGSGFGVQVRASWPGPLHDVAKFADRIWVASGGTGLLRLKGTTNKLEAVKPNIKALSFDARVNLLITAKEELVTTEDGKEFMGAGNEDFLKSRDDEMPFWLQQR